MSGIFASQFGYANPYDPVGLDTGNPSVGVTLGKKKPPRKPPEETPSRVPPETSGGTGEAANAAAASGLAAGGLGGSALVAANKMSLSQAGSASHMSAANQAANGIGLHPAPAPATHIVMPKHSGADATPPKQNSNSGGGFLGWASHEFNNVTHNPIVHDVMHFGDPFSKTDNGLAGAISPAQPVSNVIKPSNVYNPSRPSAGAIEQGGPGVVQGSVEGQPGVSAPGANAITRGTGYENMFRANLGRQFMGKNPASPADVAPAAGEGLIDSIPNDISELFSSVL